MRSRAASLRDAADPAGRGPYATCILRRRHAAGPSNRFTRAAPAPGLPSLLSGSVPDTTSTAKITPRASCTPRTANSGRMETQVRLPVMPARHLDRLTPVDASFLFQERNGAHMHVGALLIFEGPAPGYDDLLEQIESRLHLVPRYRQKLAFPPVQAGRPLWVDDPNFNLEYHVRITALPKPGSEEQLRNLAGRVFSQRL